MGERYPNIHLVFTQQLIVFRILELQLPVLCVVGFRLQFRNAIQVE